VNTVDGTSGYLDVASVSRPDGLNALALRFRVRELHVPWTDGATVYRPSVEAPGIRHVPETTNHEPDNLMIDMPLRSYLCYV